jgi:hypothetical protein
MLAVDYSALSEFGHCPQSYRRRHQQHLVPAGEDTSPSLLFGDAIHQARASLATGSAIEQALALFDSVYTRVYESEGWTDFRTPYIGRALLHAYVQKWDSPRDDHTEIGANVELSDDLFYYGRIDYVADDTVTDLKTTSALMWLPKPRLNWQLVGYAHMVGALTGQQPTQVAVDGLIVPKLSKKMQQQELPPEEEYAYTLHDNLHRRTAPVLDVDLERWHSWVLWTVDAIQRCMEQDFFPMKAPQACNRFNRRCDYEPLCMAASDEVAENLAAALYEESPWAPY